MQLINTENMSNFPSKQVMVTNKTSTLCFSFAVDYYLFILTE